MLNKYVYKHYIKRYTNNKTLNFEKLWGKQVFKNTTVICFNLLQVCLSVPPFVFAMLFIPSFHVLSSSFNVSLSLPNIKFIESLIFRSYKTESKQQFHAICIVAFCQSGVGEKHFSETLLKQNRISKTANSSPKETVASLGSKVITFSFFFFIKGA